MKCKITIIYTNGYKRVEYFDTHHAAQQFAYNEGDHVVTWRIEDI